MSVCRYKICAASDNIYIIYWRVNFAFRHIKLYIFFSVIEYLTKIKYSPLFINVRITNEPRKAKKKVIWRSSYYISEVLIELLDDFVLPPSERCYLLYIINW